MYSRGLLITMLLGRLAGETMGKGTGDTPAQPTGNEGSCPGQEGRLTCRAQHCHRHLWKRQPVRQGRE